MHTFNHFADLRQPVTAASVQVSQAASSQGVTNTRIGTSVEGLVVLTQTCDIRRASAQRPYVEVCPLVSVEPPIAAAAAAGERPNYAALPTLGDRAVADLDRVMTVEKGWLSLAATTPGWTTDSEIRRFQSAVARRYHRFAFPDDFTRSAEKLRAKIVSRHGKLTSPEGQLFSLVKQVRVRADPHWSASEVDVTLSFIIDADTLSEIPEEIADTPELNETLKWLSARQRSSSDIAERLLSESDAESKNVLWTRMAEAWARTCRPTGCIKSIFGEIRGADEYSIAEYWESSQLDLDHLSDGSTTASVTPPDEGDLASPAPNKGRMRGILSKIFHS